jgi:transposase-like protein
MSEKLSFIAAHVTDHTIRLMCRVLGVSRSWFHAWRRTAGNRAARRSRWDALIDEIRTIFEDSKQRYGAPRIHAELRDGATAYPARRSPSL